MDQQTDLLGPNSALVRELLSCGIFRNFGIRFPAPDKSPSAGSLSDISGSGSVKNTSAMSFQADSDLSALSTNQ